MNLQIMQVEVSGKEIQAVDAKGLYLELGLSTANWLRWYTRNIETNDFALEGQDYQGFIQRKSGNESVNFYLSIDFAKKLAMQVNTEKGEQVRDYFLSCERQAIQQPKLPDFNNPAESARAWANEFEQKQIAQQALIEAQPKIAHYNTVVNRTGLLTATEVGQKVGLSAYALNKRLEVLGVYNSTVKRARAFKQWFIAKDYGIIKQSSTGHSQTLFTVAGEAWVIQQLKALGVA